MHYDASQEVRAKGAGFYQFSGDEETRRKQMEELRKARDETGATRAEMGAVDLLPGEREGAGMSGLGEAAIKKSRAMEKRKRELEERRKMLDAKRRKKNPAETSDETEEPVSSAVPLPLNPRQAAAPTDDPFVILETQLTSAKGKGKTKTGPTAAADDFLAALERDIMSGSR